MEDPGNTDGRYARVRVRNRLASWMLSGISPAAVAGTARIFGRLRAARENQVARLAVEAAKIYPEGYADIDRMA